MAIPNAVWGILICNVVVAISQGLNSPNLLALVSKQANPEQQGEIMGINQSMQSVGQFIPPIIVAIFGENATSFPIILGGILIVLAWTIFVFFYNKKHSDDKVIG
jgi:DHA1 family tetracycline resistance protein-like MFS transporter